MAITTKDTCYDGQSTTPTLEVHPMIASKGHNAPASNSTNPFLRLPAELRNMIYKEALTFEGGLVVMDRPLEERYTRFRPANANMNGEANQLRYVCKQLHAETSALLFQFNDLTFDSTSYPTAYEKFLHFVGHCAPKHLQESRRITLLDPNNNFVRDPDLQDRMERLFSAVGKMMSQSTYPIIFVRMGWDCRRIDYFRRYYELNYFASANELSLMFRQHTLFNDYSDDACSHLHTIRKAMTVRPPANLRFSLAIEFDAAIIREELRGALSGEDLEEVFQTAKEVHEKGI